MRKGGKRMNTARSLRDKFARGETAFGVWAALPDAFAAELMCVGGVDYICVDQQHGLVDYREMVEMLRAIEGRRTAVPVTRVPVNQAWVIGKALDAGMQGVVVPMVSNRADVAVMGDGVLCFVMVETREGVERVDEIASTPGLDGIYVGPADLALGLGLPPNLDKEEPEHVAAVERILKSCQKYGIVPGIQCGNGKAARKQADRGFRFVTFTKDSSLLPAAVAKEVAALAVGPAAQAVSQKGYT